MIYFRGNLGGVSGIGPVEDMGIGLSWQGRIPFEPHNTFGMSDEDAEGFHGNLYLAGSVSLRRLPAQHRRRDRRRHRSAGQRSLHRRHGADDLGFQYGANGTLNLAADFSVVSFEMELARSSTIYHASREGAYAVISGQVSPDLDWLPEGMPIAPSRPSRWPARSRRTPRRATCACTATTASICRASAR
jgi:hypothetical protein